MTVRAIVSTAARHARARRLTVAAVVTCAMLVGAVWLTRTPPMAQLGLTDRYDHHFKKYSKRYFSVLSDWRWFKAQSMVESSLRRNVTSDRGAVGIMQILPDTFEEVMAHYPHHDMTDPKWNIAAGVAFNRYLYDRWGQWVSPDQRLRFMFASYNAGLTRTLRAQKLAALDDSDPDTWVTVAPYAPEQTRNYVRKVYDLMGYEIGE